MHIRRISGMCGFIGNSGGFCVYVLNSLKLLRIPRNLSPHRRLRHVGQSRFVDNGENETQHDTQSCEMQLWKVCSFRHWCDEMSHSAQSPQKASSEQRDIAIWPCGDTSGHKLKSVLLAGDGAGDAGDTDNSAIHENRVTIALFDRSSKRLSGLLPSSLH